jgi:cytochrome c oxidase subunit III
MAVGAIMWMKHISIGGLKGGYVFGAGLLGLLYILFSWWSDVIEEAEHGGFHTRVVQISHRYGMILFITSEVMCFVAWFWAFFNSSLFPGEAVQYMRAEFTGGVWPPKSIEVLDPWRFPLLNTLILLTSGTTVTSAHHALIHGDRFGLKAGLCSAPLSLGFRPTSISTRRSRSKAQSTVRPFSWRPGFMGSMSLSEQFSLPFAFCALLQGNLQVSSI